MFNGNEELNKEINIVEKDIVVIGGGCAGLECASKLYSFGFENIVVLEAQDYLGGRIRTININDDENYPLELGANWLHGFLGNPLYKLVRENPTLFYHKKKKLFSDEYIYCVDENGQTYDSNVCQTFYKLYKKWNLEAKAIWVKNKKINLKSYTDFMLSKLDEHTKYASEEEKKLKRAILQRLLKAETAESGCSNMGLCSINEYGSYLVPFGPDYEFPGGFSKLINFIAEKIPKSSILLNHPVKNIRLANYCLEQKSSAENTEMLVECYNGTMFKAKHVVVTCSVNFLQKNHSTLFGPSILSEKKISAINAVKMGTVNKIFLFYDDLSFFPKQANAIHPLYFDEKQFDDVNKYWLHKTYTFDKFYDNLILVWITGVEAEYVETLADEEIANVLTSLLRKLLPNNNVPKPSKIFKTYWNSNPWILGSYSYIDVNASTKHITDLAEPICFNKIPRILFAGEATHMRYYSTVHAAYLSGQREAKRISDYYSTTS